MSKKKNDGLYIALCECIVYMQLELNIYIYIYIERERWEIKQFIFFG